MNVSAALSLGETIRTRRRALGMTLQRLADASGCTKGYLSTIENDRRGSAPSAELLARLEKVLGLGSNQLTFAGGWKATPQAVRRHVRSLEEQSALARRLADVLRRDGIDEAFKSGELHALVGRIAGEEPGGTGAQGALSGQRANGVRVHAPGERGAARLAQEPAVLGRLGASVPLINRVAAGYPAEFTDLGYPARVADEYVGVPDVSDPDAFAARVVGDSMEPQYHAGDIVVFSPGAPTPAGSDCFVRLERNAEATFKRVYFETGVRGEEMIRLQPLNSAFPPRVVDREEVAGMYAAVYVVRPIRVGAGVE